jgi:single-strand DNA-binding protein
MQKTFLIGNLGNDPELRDANGTPVCSFSVATNEYWRDQQGNKQERTEWHKVVAWNDLANSCAQYLKKGSKIHIEGKNRTRKWTDQDGVEHSITEIHIKEMEMLDVNNNSHGDNGKPPRSISDEVPL